MEAAMGTAGEESTEPGLAPADAARVRRISLLVFSHPAGAALFLAFALLPAQDVFPLTTLAQGLLLCAFAAAGVVAAVWRREGRFAGMGGVRMHWRRGHRLVFTLSGALTGMAVTIVLGHFRWMLTRFSGWLTAFIALAVVLATVRNWSLKPWWPRLLLAAAFALEEAVLFVAAPEKRLAGSVMATFVCFAVGIVIDNWELHRLLGEQEPDGGRAPIGAAH